MKIVFDTYAWIEYFIGSKKGKVVADYLENNEIFTPLVVLLELSYKSDKEGWDLSNYLDFIKHRSNIVGINEDFVLSFGRTYNKMKKKVRDIGFVDVVILVTSLKGGAKILTGDSHFSGVENAIIL
ncbi:MAG: PIN domain-containing protein [Nanoarchaeota archaeon]